MKTSGLFISLLSVVFFAAALLGAASAQAAGGIELAAGRSDSEVHQAPVAPTAVASVDQVPVAGEVSPDQVPVAGVVSPDQVPVAGSVSVELPATGGRLDSSASTSTSALLIGGGALLLSASLFLGYRRLRRRA